VDFWEDEEGVDAVECSKLLTASAGCIYSWRQVS